MPGEHISALAEELLDADASLGPLQEAMASLDTSALATAMQRAT